MLLERGVDVNAKAQDGRVPLSSAVRNGFPAVVQMLLAKGADANVEAGGLWLLHTAVMGDAHSSRFVEFTEILRMLLDSGADTAVKSQPGESHLCIPGSTPLHVAASLGARAMVEVLLDKGAAIDCRTATGDTPLHLAACPPHPRAWSPSELVRQAPVVELLIAR